MTHTLLEAYAAARSSVFEHVGLANGWSYSAIDDNTDMGWYVHQDEVNYWDSNFTLYAGELRRVNQNGDMIAVGKDLSLMLCDLGMGGDPTTMVFDNAKQVKEFDDLPEQVKKQL